MPSSTPRGIPYPLATDLIKGPGTDSKLTRDIAALAIGADTAIGTEGQRAEAAARTQAAADATVKYGALPGRVDSTEASVTSQGAALGNHQTRLGALETLGGLAPGDISDATMASLAANPETTFHKEQSERVSSGAGAVNVEDFPSLAAAVTMALATGRSLIVDGDIFDSVVPREFFHVPVIGKGSVTVGGSKWWVNPQHLGIQTNRIYINPTAGSDTNAGIDPAAPIKSFNRLNIVMSMLREKLLDGFWEIVIQAGTHLVGEGWRMDGLRTKWPLSIVGEGTKQTILDGTNDTLGKAFLFKHFQTSVAFQNLKFQNYVGGSENDGYDTSAAVICQGPGRASFMDVDVLNCTTGISVGYGISASFHRCSFEGSEARSLAGTVSTGISVIYGASVVVGSSGGLGNVFTRCGTAVHISRNSVAHVDFNTFKDNYYGLQVSHNARGAVIDGLFNRNVIGIQLTGGAELTYSTAQYGDGADANTEANMRVGGSARLSSYQGAATSAVEYRLSLMAFETPVSTPNDTIRNPVITFPSHMTIPANTLVGEGKTIRAVIRGEAASGAGTRTIQLSKNTQESTNHQTISSITLPVGLQGHFEIELCAHTLPGTSTMKYTSNLLGNSVKYQAGHLVNIDKTHDWRLRVYQQNTVAADVLKIHSVELFVTG